GNEIEQIAYSSRDFDFSATSCCLMLYISMSYPSGLNGSGIEIGAGDEIVMHGRAALIVLPQM
ncbi:hypothetical protein P7L93_24530, partial [Vibrio parahaemolyticus]|nr:hypothetical protein [Vibrio parahaemolyticus]